MDRATQGILEVARGVLAELDLDVVLDRVLEAAQELTEARYAAIGVLSDDRSELSRFLTRGIDETTHAAIGALPRGRGVLGVLIEEPVPLRLADVGEHPRSYGFPHGHPPMRSFLGVPILVDGEPFGNLYLTEKAGGEQFSQEDEQSVVTLEATTQIARAIGGETDPEVVLDLVAKRGRALVSARALLIELVRNGELVVAASAGELPADLLGRRVNFEDSLAGHAMRTRRMQRLEQELNRARFDEHGLGGLGVDAEAGLVVPLVFRGRAHGVLIVLDRLRGGPSFSADDERLLEAFAISAATAMATAESVTSERQRQRLAAAEGERRRWARELHDETLQSLSALRLGLSVAERSDRPEAVGEAIRGAIEQLEEGIANLRALITDLRPAALDELGVQAAIEALVERSARHEIEIDLSVELAYEQGRHSARHTPEVETAVYRIVQEALTNATKHGRAARAVVEIHEDDAAVHLTVRDDGAGFEPGAVSGSGGFGLLGMRERVDLLDGELAVESAPGKGATVRARLPALRRPAAPGAPVAPVREVPAARIAEAS